MPRLENCLADMMLLACMVVIGGASLVIAPLRQAFKGRC